MPTEKPRLMVTLDQTERKRVEDYQHSHRIPSLSKALVELISNGLDIIEARDSGQEQAQIRALTSTEIQQDEAELLVYYRKLNTEGKRSLLKQACMHAQDPDYTQDISNAVV